MLKPTERSKFIKLLGMLGSDQEGEVVNAAKKAMGVLKSEGLSWADVIDVAETPDFDKALIFIDARSNQLQDQEGERFAQIKMKYFSAEIDDSDRKFILYYKLYIEEVIKLRDENNMAF